jgi:serine/threonine protein kinase
MEEKMVWDTTPSEQIELALFETAQSLPDPAAREAFLAQACTGNAAMRTRLEQLLAAQEQAKDFFHGAAAARAAMTTEVGASRSAAPAPVEERDEEPSRAEGPGARIGRYKLLERIGEGGCGCVYFAEQKEPVRRRVALKVIRAGMDSQRVIARFEAERQALALMDHPNIAHVLDAGTTETGRPYFVMELVPGARITEYCDTNQLGTRQRIELFIQVCHAIQHAHQKGIIHRDIKPSNILVSNRDGVAVPKVIDFGIARAIEGRLTDNTMFTACDQFLGTPAYMSPEQAEGGPDLDTRSDVYSLGVLLCELLTGCTPFDTKKLLESGLYEMLRTLREEEPQAPSAILAALDPAALSTVAAHQGAEPGRLIASLRGDLDWVVLKAISKDRTLRYDTVNALAMDLHRFCKDEPVLARPPNRLYQCRKLVHRNKALFAAGAAVVVALLAGFGTTMWLLVREHQARQEAVQARERADLLLAQSTARENISLAAVLLSEGKKQEADELLAKTPVGILELSLETASVFSSLGDWNATLGRWKEAAEWYGLFIQAHQNDHSAGMVDIMKAATASVQAGNLPAYRKFCDDAVSRYGASADPVSASILLKASLLLPAEDAVLQRLLPLGNDVEKAVAKAGPWPAGDTFQLAHQALTLGLLNYRRGNYAKALAWGKKCLAYPDTCRSRDAAVHALSALGHHQLGQHESARAELTQARALLQRWFAHDPAFQDPHEGTWLDWRIVQILEREAAGLIETDSRPATASP